MLENTRYLLSMSPMLVLGGFVSPTYDEVRIHSRALSHADIIKTANAGPDTLSESEK